MIIKEGKVVEAEVVRTVVRECPEAEVKASRTVVKRCPEIWVDSPVGMATTSPVIPQVITAWECLR